jgi:hypothetical protein
MEKEEIVLISRQELMKRLNISAVTFWRYVRNNKFPYYKAGRKYYFNWLEVLMAMRNN